MSNLGLYQWITTFSKKVGGPKKFILLIMSLGYGGGKTVELIIKFIIKSAKKEKNSMDTGRIFHVASCGKAESGVELNTGDKFKVLATDGKAVLIERIGDKNNPYFVSADFLRSISDYDC